MKTSILLLAVGLAAIPTWAAGPADEVKAAAQKLADQPNYSWTTKSESAQAQGGGGGRFGGGGGGNSEGKTEKDGYTWLTFKQGENTTEAARKGDKVAVKSGADWKTPEELADGAANDANGGGRGNRGQFLARRVQQAKAPAAEAQEILGRVAALKKDGDALAGDLSSDGIKQMMSFGGRPGGGNADGPDTSGIKGTAKFWIKDGVLTKYETHVEGKMKGRQDREFEVNRTTTVEIKDVGSTKLDVPAEAKKKLTKN